MRSIMRHGLVGTLIAALAGVAIAQDAATQDPPATLLEKHQKLEEALRKGQNAGKELSQVAKILEGFDPLMKERKFVEAEALLDRAIKAVDDAKAAPGRPPATLIEKHQKLENAIQGAQAEKKDLTGAMKLLQELDPLVKSLKFEEAEQLIDRVLKTLEETKPGSDPTLRLQEKVQRIEQGVQKWQGDGRDASPIAKMMQEFGPMMQAGKIPEAEALLDQALKILESEKKD